MTCLDCKSLLGNVVCKSIWTIYTRITEHNTPIYGRAEAVINRASELWKLGEIPKMTVHKEITHKIKSYQPNLMILVLLYL